MSQSNGNTLPLFPLPVVLFPGAELPLHIFEDRYKLMIGKVLDEQAPFGVVFWDGESTSVAETGCTAMISDVKKFDDGRMNLMTMGERRFKIVDVIQEQPYIIATIEYLEDNGTSEKADVLVKDIASVLKEILRLSSKLVDKEFEIQGTIPEDPVELSYWVAANFYGSPDDQQELLEMSGTEARLKEELAVLDSARKHLAAKVSLKDALG
ncbi:LON peptidase substrate-binding domain-containing protein [Candidatus Obscuribacterales bacterium]|jgi:ATP-dependent Lon protease|nr:LON peptidase substrate-binding domain-containing protein [Candidatus Obscuribacterales bacterium]MBX3135143.1 LON peptidase substrate-binding domain-containing protein [Candidatus Obscuribacterales bacterium]MBX3150265.1 LON peptidase substrate-binding domain-containing protein [Candidatus Obscuribacterales bacterium]